MCVSAALTFQTGGVKLNEELCSACRLHNGFDALKLYVGLLRSLGQTWGNHTDQEEETQSYCLGMQMTASVVEKEMYTDFERPKRSGDRETRREIHLGKVDV